MGIDLNEQQVRGVIHAMRKRLNTVDSLPEGEVERIINDISGEG